MTIFQLNRSGHTKRPPCLAVEFNAAKIPGRGEDADPLLRITHEFYECPSSRRQRMQ